MFGGVPDVGAVEINPQGFVVDQPVDESDGNIVTGDISLREAIEMASDFSATADTITFASNTFADDPFDFTYAVKLTLGQMTIRGPTEINWVEKYPLTIDANGASRVFNLQFAPTGSAIGFTGLRITGGKAIEGGGILGGHENLTLTNCVITGNTATSFGGGGVAQLGDGVLTAVDCAFTDNTASGTGGAFETFGYKSKTTLTRCTISGNTAFQGAGGYARYELIAEGCAVFGNTTTTDVGGGFLVRYGPATIRNSTISGNTAKNFGGGVALGFDFAGTLLVENSTIVNNAAQTSQGGGIIRLGNVATISIASSIVSGNSPPQFPDIRSNGTVNVNFSAVGDPNGFVPTGGNNLPFGTNLKLGALQLNGGPTPTHALLVGSPAVDAGSNPAGLTTDQRGTVYARTVNPGTDIGAYETAKVTLVTNTNDSGPGSLRQAALDAIFSPGQARWCDSIRPSLPHRRRSHSRADKSRCSTTSRSKARRRLGHDQRQQ